MNANSGILLGVILLIGSCNDKGKTSSSVLQDSAIITKAAGADTAVSGCFSQVMRNDTALLEVENNKGNVTGVLTYILSKTAMTVLQGEQSGDIIKGWYLLTEGVASPGILKINGNELWRR